jgi:serine/threonine protein kinase
VAAALLALQPAGVGAQSPLAALSLPEGEAVSFSGERSTAPSKAAAKAAAISASETAAAEHAKHALLWGSLPSVRAVLIDFGLARSVSAKAVRHALIQAAKQDKLAGVAPPPGNTQDEALSSSSTTTTTSSSTSSGSSRVLSVSNLSLMDMSAVGNRLFAAPEILRGARAVPSASGAPRVADYGFCVDSYSLGRTLRHALSGASPEKNESYIFRATTPGLLSCCFGGGGSGGRLGGADDDRPDDAEGLRGDAAAALVRDDDSAAGRRARAQELQRAGKQARAFRSRRELPPQAKDLLAGLLQRDPAKRTSMRAAATHPWCAGVPPWTTSVGPGVGGSSVAGGAARASSGGSASSSSSPSSVSVPWTGALHSSSAAAGGMFRRACGLSSVGLSGVKPSGGRFLDLSGHGNGSDLDASGHAVGLDLSSHG